jgi:sulfur-carrier protein
MSIKILYFAALRDAVGRADETLDMPENVATIGELRDYLAARGEQWSALDAGRSVRAARNHRMVKPEEPVAAGDEIAFFPPVTVG